MDILCLLLSHPVSPVCLRHLWRRFMSHPRKVLAAVVALPVLLVSQLFYGEVTAGVVGTVADQSGATVPNVRLTLSQVSTGLVRHAKTDSSGSYEFLSV